MKKVFRLLSLVVFLGLGPAMGGAHTTPASASDLEELLSRFNETQAATHSLTANFTERKNLSLLDGPVISKGKFFYSKPTRIKWEYSGPEPRVFLLTEEQYLAYYPDQKRAEEVPLSRFSSRRVFRVFGIGQTAEDLRKFFEISLSEDNVEEGTFLMILTPKRRRVKDRLLEVRFWVDRETYLPRRLEYLEMDGDSTSLTFYDIQVNPEITDSRFVIQIPEDVQITNSFSGFSGSSTSR